MILHRKHWMIGASQSFDRMIVQTQMCERDLTEQCVHHRWPIWNCADRMHALHRKIVVLRRDLDSSRAEIDDRMIRPMMAELQLIGLEPQRETENLMAQANAEDRPASN